MLNTERTRLSDPDTKQIDEPSISYQLAKSIPEPQPSQQFSITFVTKSQPQVEKSLLQPKKSERHIAAFMNDPL
jgi:hypothetical protein